MRVLYVVFVLSIIALIWTAVAVARHIRQHEAGHKLSGKRAPEMIEEPETVSRSDSE